jgi:hypothetical protein
MLKKMHDIFATIINFISSDREEKHVTIGLCEMIDTTFILSFFELFALHIYYCFFTPVMCGCLLESPRFDQKPRSLK